MKGYIGTNVSNAEEEEMEFLTQVQQFYLTQFPNPNRTGCPTPEELMQLAWRRNIDQLRKVALHLTHCSPCCQQHHELAKKYREYVHSEKHQRVFKYKSIAIVTGIAALLLFGLGISMMTWQWLKVRASHDGINVQDSSNRKATPDLSNPNESGKT